MATGPASSASSSARTTRLRRGQLFGVAAELGPCAGLRRAARARVVLDERRVRPARRRLRHAADVLMPHNPPLLRRARRGRRASARQGPAGPSRADTRARTPCRSARGSRDANGSDRRAAGRRATRRSTHDGSPRRSSVCATAYNATWERNWGFVPMTEREILHMAGQLKPFYIPGLVPFVEKDGRGVGFGLALPDLNVVLRRHRSGRLLPALLFLLLRRPRRKRFGRVRGSCCSACMPEYRGKGIDALLWHWIWTRAAEHGVTWGEASWILERQSRRWATRRAHGVRALQDPAAVRPADMRALVTGRHAASSGATWRSASSARGERGHRPRARSVPSQGSRRRAACASSTAISTGARRWPRPRAAPGRGRLPRRRTRQARATRPSSARQPRRHTEPGCAPRARRRRAPRARLVAWPRRGPAERGKPRLGDEPERPITAYGRSKLAGERSCAQAARLDHRPARRSSTGRATREFLRLFRLARRGIAPVFGDGAQELSGVFATGPGRGARGGRGDGSHARSDLLRLPRHPVHEPSSSPPRDRRCARPQRTGRADPGLRHAPRRSA